MASGPTGCASPSPTRTHPSDPKHTRGERRSERALLQLRVRNGDCGHGDVDREVRRERHEALSDTARHALAPAGETRPDRIAVADHRGRAGEVSSGRPGH